jgi:hypothetical protein
LALVMAETLVAHLARPSPSRREREDPQIDLYSTRERAA